jgi:hypothetical protein
VLGVLYEGSEIVAANVRIHAVAGSFVLELQP